MKDTDNPDLAPYLVAVAKALTQLGFTVTGGFQRNNMMGYTVDYGPVHLVALVYIAGYNNYSAYVFLHCTEQIEGDISLMDFKVDYNQGLDRDSVRITL